MSKMVHCSTEYVTDGNNWFVVEKYGIDEFRIIKSFSVGESEIEITEETYDNFKEKRNSTDVSTDGDGKGYNNVHNIGSQYRRESRQNNKVGKRTSKGNKNRYFDIYSKFYLTKTSEGKSLSPEEVDFYINSKNRDEDGIQKWCIVQLKGLWQVYDS